MLAAINSFGQNNFMTFPENVLEDGSNLTSLPQDDYTGAPASFSHAGIKNPLGETEFFIVDDRVYNQNSTQVAYFSDGLQIRKPYSEIIIVNKPGSCDQFYIFFAAKSGVGATSPSDIVPYFAIWDRSLGTLAEDANDNNIFRIDGTLIESWDDIINPTLPRYVEMVHFAATNERSDGERWIYISTNDKLYRVDLTCDGLEPSGWEKDYATFSTSVQSPSDYRTEMELYEDTVNDVIRFAIPYNDFDNDSTTSNSRLSVFEVDSALGQYVTNSEKILTYNEPSSDFVIKGVEFSPNGEYVYILHQTTSSS
jgi:hypothetical protein